MAYFIMEETTTDYWLNPDDGKWYRNKYSHYDSDLKTKWDGEKYILCNQTESDSNV